MIEGIVKSAFTVRESTFTAPPEDAGGGYGGRGEAEHLDLAAVEPVCVGPKSDMFDQPGRRFHSHRNLPAEEEGEHDAMGASWSQFLAFKTTFCD